MSLTEVDLTVPIPDIVKTAPILTNGSFQPTMDRALAFELTQPNKSLKDCNVIFYLIISSDHSLDVLLAFNLLLVCLKS